MLGQKKRTANVPLRRQQAASEEVGERLFPAMSFAESITSEADGFDDYNDEAAGDEVFRRQMRATAKVRKRHTCYT